MDEQVKVTEAANAAIKDVFERLPTQGRMTGLTIAFRYARNGPGGDPALYARATATFKVQGLGRSLL